MEMQRHLIILTQGRRNPSLGILRAGFVKLVFSQHQNASGAREFNGGAYTGNSSAENKEINLLLLSFLHGTPMIALVSRGCNKFWSLVVDGAHGISGALAKTLIRDH